MKKKRNNKGFSLVELIVVMAIMAILAVTLAPRLTQYIEKSRVASDQNVVNSIYNATKLALVDETLLTAFKTSTPKSVDNVYVVDLSSFYSNSNGSFTAGSPSNAAFKEIASVIDDFKLKSKNGTSSSNSDIVIVYDSVNDNVTVLLDYDGVATFTDAAVPTATEITNMLNAANYKVTQ